MEVGLAASTPDTAQYDVFNKYIRMLSIKQNKPYQASIDLGGRLKGVLHPFSPSSSVYSVLMRSLCIMSSVTVEELYKV